MLTRFLLALIISLSVFDAEARKKKTPVVQKLSGVVQSCHDGDTCRVKLDNETISVRFAGIDTPEIKQKYGVQAKNFTEGLLKGKTVDLECDGTSFNRITCTVFQAGININAEIVRKGWAFESVKYSKGKYSAALAEAKDKKLGIWKEADVVSPYCFRKSKSGRCKKNPSYMP